MSFWTSVAILTLSDDTIMHSCTFKYIDARCLTADVSSDSPLDKSLIDIIRYIPKYTCTNPEEPQRTSLDRTPTRPRPQMEVWRSWFWKNCRFMASLQKVPNSCYYAPPLQELDETKNELLTYMDWCCLNLTLLIWQSSKLLTPCGTELLSTMQILSQRRNVTNHSLILLYYYDRYSDMLPSLIISDFTKYLSFNSTEIRESLSSNSSDLIDYITCTKSVLIEYDSSTTSDIYNPTCHDDKSSSFFSCSFDKK